MLTGFSVLSWGRRCRRAACSFPGGSRGMLAVFRTTLRLMDDETLSELRNRLVELKEHPAGIRAIHRELEKWQRRRVG